MMNKLEWTECIKSLQLKAQGTGVVYWLIGNKGFSTLWINPDSIDDGYNSIRGSAADCMKFAELLEAEKTPKPVSFAKKTAEASRILRIPFEIIEYAKLAELVPISLARELLDLVEKSHSYRESE